MRTVADLSEMEFRNCDNIRVRRCFKDPTAFLVIMFDGEKFYVVEEYYEVEDYGTTRRSNRRNYGTKASRLPFYRLGTQQTRFDLAQNYDITTTNAAKSVNDGIAHVSSLVENNRLIIDQRCLETLRSMDQYRWDPNPNLIREKPRMILALIWLTLYVTLSTL